MFLGIISLLFFMSACGSVDFSSPIVCPDGKAVGGVEKIGEDEYRVICVDASGSSGFGNGTLIEDLSGFNNSMPENGTFYEVMRSVS